METQAVSVDNRVHIEHADVLYEHSEVHLISDYMDMGTGEIIPQKRYIYPGGYITMGLVNITRLISLKLPAQGYRLALLMAARVAPVSNLCHATNESYAVELGVKSNRVSHLLSKLAESGLIYRMNPRLVMVNPGWCFHGTPSQQQIAMESWAKLHPLGVVKSTRKTA